MTEPWRIELLGGLRALQGDRVITRFRSHKFGALLAYLAYFSNRSHPREILIDTFWPEFEPGAGRNNLSTALSTLRHQLEPPGVPSGTVLIADRENVQLNPASVITDVAEYNAAIRFATGSGSSTERTQNLMRGVDLYKGELLLGYYDEWIDAEREQLAGAHVQALRQLVRHRAKARDLQGALQFASRLVAANPLAEDSHRDLIRLYIATHQPSAALQQYRDLERRLQAELGSRPSAATRQIVRDLITASVPGTEGRETDARSEPAGKAVSSQPVVGQTPISALPIGTVTFLLTDIERSTALWEEKGDAFKEALSIHHSLMRREFQLHGGREVHEAGDGFVAAFSAAGDALTCAISAQRALSSQEWPETVDTPAVRMALHTGDVEIEDGQYRGLVLHRGSRILTASHGGQILCSEATSVLLLRDLPAGTRLMDIGVYRLRGVPLPERLCQVQHPSLQDSFPPLNAEPGYQGSLPMQFTRFFGREVELARLQQMIDTESARMITLSGAGGTGKTRLAVEFAKSLAERYHGAVWFVPLADLSDSRLIAGAILDTLKIARSASMEPIDQVVQALTGRASLLVLDNYEQLVEEGATVVRALVDRVPELTCIVTSRMLLGISGEREFAVPPLAVPHGAADAESLTLYESVQLFVDRAQSVKPDFHVTGKNAAAVAQLCERLEGIPLAIELAAARAQVLTPLQIVAQLENRFDFLVSRKRDAEERHRTMRAAIDWSYRLLAPELQRFLNRLSVFRGGWTFEAAEIVCEEPMALDMLAQLKECSLILTDETREQMRFRMLEMLREFAWEKLNQNGDVVVRDLHLSYFLSLAEQAEPQLRGKDQTDWLERLEGEIDNLRASLEWAALDRARVVAGLRMAGSLCQFWEVRGHHSEGRMQLERAIERDGDRAITRERAKAILGIGTLAYRQGEFTEASKWLNQSLYLSQELSDRMGISDSMTCLGWVASDSGDFATATDLYQESLALKRDLGDALGIASLLSNLGSIAIHQGNSHLASELFRESLAIQRDIGNSWGIATSINNLGVALYAQGDFDGAQTLHEESLAIRRTLEDNRGIAMSLANLGLIASTLKQYGRAAVLCKESLSIRRKLSDRLGIALAMEALATNSAAERLPLRATILWAAAGALRQSIGVPVHPIPKEEYDSEVASVSTTLGTEAFAAAWDRGRAFTMDEAINYALQGASE